MSGLLPSTSSNGFTVFIYTSNGHRVLAPVSSVTVGTRLSMRWPRAKPLLGGQCQTSMTAAKHKAGQSHGSNSNRTTFGCAGCTRVEARRRFKETRRDEVMEGHRSAEPMPEKPRSKRLMPQRWRLVTIGLCILSSCAMSCPIETSSGQAVKSSDFACIEVVQ